MANKQKLTDWTFQTKHVQPEDNLANGHVSSESIVLVAGPPQVDDNFSGAGLIPIGVIESATIAQNKQIQQIYEIGSSKSFLIPGRTQINVGLSRILFSGDSILSALYEYQEDNASELDFKEYDHDDYTGAAPGYPTKDTGDGKYFLNLASSYFNHPTGLGMIFHDSDNDAMAMIYLEDCQIRSHQISIGANQTIVMENVNIMADNVFPIDYGSTT